MSKDIINQYILYKYILGEKLGEHGKFRVDRIKIAQSKDIKYIRKLILDNNLEYTGYCILKEAGDAIFPVENKDGSYSDTESIFKKVDIPVHLKILKRLQLKFLKYKYYKFFKMERVNILLHEDEGSSEIPHCYHNYLVAYLNKEVEGHNPKIVFSSFKDIDREYYVRVKILDWAHTQFEERYQKEIESMTG